MLQALVHIYDMKAEFASLWTLPHHAKHLGLSKLQIFGDSKVVIEWAKEKFKVHNVQLQSLLSQIKDYIQSLEWASFSHIFRGINTKTDKLSKEVLSLQGRAFLS